MVCTITLKLFFMMFDMVWYRHRHEWSDECDTVTPRSFFLLLSRFCRYAWRLYSGVEHVRIGTGNWMSWLAPIFLEAYPLIWACQQMLSICQGILFKASCYSVRVPNPAVWIVKSYKWPASNGSNGWLDQAPSWKNSHDTSTLSGAHFSGSKFRIPNLGYGWIWMDMEVS